MLKKTLLASIFGVFIGVIDAFGVPTEMDKKTVASKAYVDVEVAKKQNKIPAANQPGVGAGETVMTYTATGNGQIGERGLYSDISSYDASTDGDKLITASALNATFTNLPTTPTTKLECANQSDGCTLWTIVDQTAYCDMIVSPNLCNEKITQWDMLTSGRKGVSLSDTGNYSVKIILKEGKTIPSGLYVGLGHIPTNGNSWLLVGGWIISNGTLAQNGFATANLTGTSKGLNFFTSLSPEEIFDIFDVMLVKGSYTSATMPDYMPYGQICIDQTNAHGKNLFDKTTATPGAIIASTGAQGTNPNYYGSDYIPVTAGAQYYLSGNNFATGNVGAWYKADKTYLSGINANGLLTAPTGAYYIRFSMGAAAIDTTQLELGSTATPYEPYN